MSGIVIERATDPTSEVRALVGELNAVLGGLYEPHQQHGLALDRLFAPEMRFFVAQVDGAAMACGGVALFDDYAEVKRMYTRPQGRGRGLAKALLARIEAEARSAGKTMLRLETGVRQLTAIGLYEATGFCRCGAFGAYAAMPPAAIETSLFYEKRLQPLV